MEKQDSIISVKKGDGVEGEAGGTTMKIHCPKCHCHLVVTDDDKETRLYADGVLEEKQPKC